MKYRAITQFDGANPAELYKRPNYALNLSTEIAASDRKRLLSASRRLYANLGPARGAINDKAMYSVGNAWMPIFTGKDQKWGMRAAEWLVDQFYPMADISGRDFVTALYLDSVSIDRDGDAFYILTEYETGFPCIQRVAANRVDSDDLNASEIKDGPYKGLRQQQGVVFNRSGRPVAFALTTEDPKKPRYVSAQSMGHMFEPEYYDQPRGIPGFSHAILDLLDLQTTQGYERQAAMLLSSIGLIEYNEQGAADPYDPATGLSAPVTPDGPTVHTETIAGGTTRYFKANSGAKVETIKPDRPGQGWENFMDRLIRNSCTGFGWPYELTWTPKELGGANIRLITSKARRAIRDRQELLLPQAKRMVGYAVAKAIKLGLLPPSDEWWRWSFEFPEAITVDAGRDAAQNREDMKLGIRTHQTDAAERGISWKQERDQIQSEVSDLLTRAKALSTDHGISLDAAINLLSQRTPNAQVSTAQTQDNSNA